MYYIAEAVLNENPPVSKQEIDEVLHPAHIAMVNRAIDDGMILLAGPRPDGKGGFLLFKGDDEAAIWALLDTDPMVTSGAQHYVLSPWLIFDKAENLKDLF